MSVEDARSELAIDCMGLDAEASLLMLSRDSVRWLRLYLWLLP